MLKQLISTLRSRYQGAMARLWESEVLDLDTITAEYYKSAQYEEREKRSPEDRWRNLCDRGILHYFGRANAVLDSGCGDGSMVKMLARRGFTKMLVGHEIIAEDEPLPGLSVVRRCGWKEFERIPKPSSFDLIISEFVIEHISQPQWYLRSLCNMASDDGVLFLRFPALMLLAEWKALVTEWASWVIAPKTPTLLDPRTGHDHAVFLPSVRKLKTLLEATGWKVEKVSRRRSLIVARKRAE